MPPKKDKDQRLFHLYTSKKYKQCEQQIVNHIANKDECDELTWLTYSHNKLICQYFLFRKSDPTLIDELIQLIEHFVKQPIFKKKKNHKNQKSKFEFLNGEENKIKITDLPLYFRILRIVETILALCIKHQRFEQGDIICDIFITRNGQNMYFMKQKIFLYFYLIRRCQGLGKLCTNYQIVHYYSKLKSSQLLSLPRQIQVQILLTLDKLQIKLKQSYLYKLMQLKFRQNIPIYQDIHSNAISLFALKRYMELSIANRQNQQKNQNQQLFYYFTFFLQYTKTLYTQLNNLFMPLNNKFQYSEWNLQTVNQNLFKLYKFFKDHNNSFKIADLLQATINTIQVQIFLKSLKASRQQCLIPDNLQPGHYASMDRVSIETNLFLSLLCLRKNKHNCQMAYNYMKRIQKSLDYNYRMYYRKGQCCINLYRIIFQENHNIQLNTQIQKIKNTKNQMNHMAIFSVAEDIPVQKDEASFDKDVNRKQFQKNIRWQRVKSLLQEAQSNFRSCLICFNAQKQKGIALTRNIKQSYRKQPVSLSPLTSLRAVSLQTQDRIIQGLAFVYVCLGKYAQCLKLFQKYPQSQLNPILRIYKTQCQFKLNRPVSIQKQIKDDALIQVQSTKNYYRGQIGRTFLSSTIRFNELVKKTMQNPTLSKQKGKLEQQIASKQNFVLSPFLYKSLQQIRTIQVCRSLMISNINESVLGQCKCQSSTTFQKGNVNVNVNVSEEKQQTKF